MEYDEYERFLAACEAECAIWISRCVSSIQPPGFVCQLNIIVFLIVIFLAVFTGVLIPISCLFCFVFGVPKKMRKFFLWRDRNDSDEESAKLHPNRSGFLSLPPVISDSDSPAPIVVIPRIRKSEHSIPLHTPKRYQKRIHWKSAGSIS